MPADSRDMVLVPEVQYEVWQDDMPVASADRLSDAQHYMAMYGQDGPVKAKTAFTYRVDGFTSSAPPSPIAAGEDPHEMFEAFLAEAIATSPKPLQELGRFLSDLLGEDDWKTADRYLIALATIRADAWRALTEIADRPLIQEPKQGDYGKDRERCPSCRHAWHVDEQPHHALSCERMLATKVLSASPARGEGDAPVAWRESFIAEEEEGPVVGILIDLPDGSQIWSGECSNALLEQAAEQEGSPADSGLFLMVAAKGKPTRPVAQVATVEDGIALARAVAACHAQAHPTPATPAGEELREKVARLIDPWAFNQCEWASRDDNDEVLREFLPKRDEALAKADAILSALQPQAEGDDQ